MHKIILTVLVMGMTLSSQAANDQAAIERAVLDYIESQHLVKPEMVVRGIDKKLIKRTYWQKADGTEFIMKADYQTMVDLAARYNRDGDKFPDQPVVKVEVFDIDQRVASVKLTVDDWIDYMHLYKNDQGQWKILNVLWQFNDINAHKSQ